MASLRKKRLQRARSKLSAGVDVPAQQMRSALTSQQYAEFERRWEEQRELRRAVKDKPDVVREYERRLRDASLEYSKADDHSNKGRSKTARAMFDRSETMFERLWEYVAENVAGRVELEMWFDRPVTYTPETFPGLTPGCMPMVVTSKSVNNRREGVFPGIQSKQQVKRDAIEAALDAMDETNTDKEATLARIKSTRAMFKRYLDD